MSPNATPPAAPHDTPHDTRQGAPHGAPTETDGPRVSRDEVRDLARLRRSRADRKVAGVAGGIARHLDIDPLIPRVLLAVLIFFGGAGLLVYAALWLVVPADGSDEATIRLDDRSRAVAVTVVGAVAALAVLGDSLGGWGFPWPVVLVGVVVLLVLQVRHREPRRHPLLRDTDLGTPSPGIAGVPETREHRGPVLFWYALALTALGVGVLGIADTAGADVPGSAFPAVALGTCAALLLLGAFWGRAGGLILLGLVATAATASATVVGELDTGRLRATPTTAASVQDRYELAIGEVDLDLTEVVDPEALDGRSVEVEVTALGRIEVTVPDDLDVVVRSFVDGGERRIDGDRVGDDGTRETTTIDGGPDAPRLVLDVSVRVGQIVIDREDTP